jgi:hypothetical protein
MTQAAKSLYVFSIYLLILGVILIVFPNTLLTLSMMPETSEVWIRVVGMLVFNLGLYYFMMAPTNHTMFLTLTVYIRASIILWFILFVLMEWVSPMLIGFGVIDLLSAIWTYTALRKA